MQDFFSQLIHIAQIQWVQQAFWTVVLALATLATSRIVARAMRHILDRDSNPLPSSSIIINIVRATILTLGASIILDVIYNINANAIITTLGVGGIAISLGFQDTLSNLIGGLQVTFMGIVRPGDNIEVGSETGVVQDVSWRHTTIKDALGQTVIVPNSIISKTALVHLLPASRGAATARGAGCRAIRYRCAGRRAGCDGKDGSRRCFPCGRGTQGGVLGDHGIRHQGQGHLCGRGSR